ncbi:hypothetical protein FE257_007788 [Aspergillus nanangensis]|uniref:Uncharacterized protein n=1 Tax=Aspergillus nanangensis TaxID=2582783 RepID=A0AAD4CX04_ASPNN|nr:hypothetical protein FE257_007788 [Aspergillus nanangensis]
MSPAISNLLGPVVALNGWTFVMEAWMYVTRIPAFQRANIAADNTQTRQQIDLKTPAHVRWKADNFNNLLEQPTQFYAIALVLALARAGKDDATDAYLAWGIMRRFALYVLSSGILAVMTGRAAMAVF